MSYDHLLPPEKPRGQAAKQPTDLDCYPPLDGREFRNVTPEAMLGIAAIGAGALLFPFGIPCMLQGAMLVAFSRSRS